MALNASQPHSYTATLVQSHGPTKPTSGLRRRESEVVCEFMLLAECATRPTTDKKDHATTKAR